MEPGLNIDKTSQLVRLLKGTSFIVYFLLAAENRPVKKEWLELNTGYSDKPVGKALAFLADLKLVEHDDPGWALTDNGRKLFEQSVVKQITPGMGVEHDPDAQPEAQDGAAQAARQAEVQGSSLPAEAQEEAQAETDSLQTQKGRKLSDLKRPATTTKLINTHDLEESLVAAGGAGRRISDLPPEDDPPEAFFDEKLAVLRQCSVAEPLRSRLARRPELSAQQILALDLDLKRWKGPRYSPGLLIYALEHHQEPTREAMRDAAHKLGGGSGTSGYRYADDYGVDEDYDGLDEALDEVDGEMDELDGETGETGEMDYEQVSPYLAQEAGAQEGEYGAEAGGRPEQALETEPEPEPARQPPELVPAPVHHRLSSFPRSWLAPPASQAAQQASLLVMAGEASRAGHSRAPNLVRAQPRHKPRPGEAGHAPLEERSACRDG